MRRNNSAIALIMQGREDKAEILLGILCNLDKNNDKSFK
jgi:hypothetical protein